MTQSFPFVVAGKRVQCERDTSQLVKMRGEEVIELPVLTPSIVSQILGQDRLLLQDVPIQEIVAFLSNVGKSWKNLESSRRRLYIRYLVRYLGFSEKMAEHEANWIAMLLCSHYRILDALDTELGDRHVLDQWIPIEEVEIRAFPKGRSLHVLPGNVPLAGVTSIIRALVTKNVCVVKTSSDDPITPIFMALSFLDVDSSHPVSRAMSVIHWKGGEDTADIHRLVHASDIVCAWGGADSLEWVTKAARAQTELIKFGPRRSFAVVGEGAHISDTARQIVHDVSVYDQRACFSIQRVFVKTALLGELVERLAHAFTMYDSLLPKGHHSFDEFASRSLARLEAEYAGSTVMADRSQNWMIIVGSGAECTHPLGRTLFIHPYESTDEIAAHIDETIQTIAVAPWSLGRDLRDQWAAAGAARIVDTGLANVFRIGGSHDAMYPLQRLVRIVSHEAPKTTHIKGITLPVDQTRFLQEDMFGELIP
jgi:long-chain-fatty-acyl-CoA reductase